jgi:hypothetical protein
MGVFNLYYWIPLGILGLIEAAILFIFYKRGVKAKILIPVFLVLFVISAVIVIPTVHYPAGKNPKILKNMTLK